MHNDFSEWYRLAGIELQNDALLKRWAGVETFAAGRDEIISLAELFFGFYDATEQFIGNFRSPFQEADAAFRMRDNNQELSVLAGAKLVSVMEGASIELGDFAAMALVSCAAQNLRIAPCVNEIPERAARHLSGRSIHRNQIDLTTPSEAGGPSPEIAQIQRDLAVVGEESNVLWWIFGESSRDLNKRWSECPVPQTTLLAGKELADLTRIIPGPAAASALLDKVIKNAKPKPPAHILVKDAIAELPMEWRQNFAKNYCPTKLLNLCPVSHSIKMSVELADGDAWVQAFQNSAKIQHGGKIAPHLLAYQVFVECLLASFLTKLN
jgi:hypothetical protein